MALSLLAERLGSGSVVGIDRSPKMISAAAKRNAEHVESGQVTLLAEPFETAELPEESFDKVFATHVAAFWRQPELLLPLTARLLKRGGTLHLFNQSPGWRERSDPSAFARQVTTVLDAYGFRPGRPQVEVLDSTPIVHISGSPFASKP